MNFRITSFTLIELLIVIVVIGILVSALIPRLIGAQSRARDIARIGHMKQMQNALAMYYVDNNNYPGYSHYVSIQGVGCPYSGHDVWTGVFDDNFTIRYTSPLPLDPLSDKDRSYCYGYSRLDNSTGYCTAKDGSIIHLDGKDVSGSFSGPMPGYVLTFKAENDLRDKYPRYGSVAGNRYCVVGY